MLFRQRLSVLLKLYDFSIIPQLLVPERQFTIFDASIAA